MTYLEKRRIVAKARRMRTDLIRSFFARLFGNPGIVPGVRQS
ncbi:hypothetical protein [Salipiger sp.]